MVLPNPLDDVYGPFERVTPGEGRRILYGFDGRWWVAGGWAIESFTETERPHEDLDICVERSRTPDLINHLAGSLHVWAAGSGALKAMLEPDEPIPPWAGQLWVRENARSPWLVDFLISPVVDDLWVYKRDPFLTKPWSEATRIGADGIRYETPEVTLLYKAKHDRSKDRADLEAALPLMGAEAVRWLRDGLTRAHPGHPWQARLGV